MNDAASEVAQDVAHDVDHGIDADGIVSGSVTIERNEPGDADALPGFGSVRLGETAGYLAQVFALRTLVGRVRTIALPNVGFLPFVGMLYRGDRPIRQTRYLVSDHEYANARIADRTKHLPGKVAIGFNRNYYNYYHWVAQCLPAIDWSLRFSDGAGVCVALPDLDQAWQRESLALLGYGAFERVRCEPHMSYGISDALYCEFLNGCAAFCVSRMALDTHRRIAARVSPIDGPAIPGAGRGRRGLYIARTDTPNRPMANEPDVIGMMRRRGIDIMLPGATPFADQVRLARAADVVIGPHGAGMTNVAFCRPGTAVYELLPEFWANPCFRAIAQGAGLAYTADVFPSLDDAIDKQQRPWTVDLDVLGRELDRIMESHTG